MSENRFCHYVSLLCSLRKNLYILYANSKDVDQHMNKDE